MRSMEEISKMQLISTAQKKDARIKNRRILGHEMLLQLPSSITFREDLVLA